MPAAEASAALLRICGSRRWVEAMLADRPFREEAAVLAAAGKAWRGLSRDDWLEAFSHHPRIGERNLAQAKFAATAAQSSREQSGMAAATDEQRAEFTRLNAEYEAKFGHVFLICASGRSAAEMLSEIRRRIERTAAEELAQAGVEQEAIVKLRLERMLTS